MNPIRFIFCIFLVTSLTAYAKEKPVLNIYNWSGYIGSDTIEDFEKETGIHINYDVVDSSDLMETKLLTGKSGYDLVFPSAYPALPRLIKSGAIRKLDKDKLPNIKYLSPSLMGLLQEYDPGNQYTVIYHWSTMGLGINVQKVKELIPDADLTSLALLFEPENAEKLAKCGITVLDTGSDFLPTAFHYYGKSINTATSEDIDYVYHQLSKIRPYIRQFNSSTYIDGLASGDICLAFGYSGDILQAREKAEEARADFDVKYIVAQTGAEIAFDIMVIPADAEHPDNAHRFINYVLNPKVIYKISNEIFYPNAIPDSYQYLNKRIRDDPNIILPKEVMDKSFIRKKTNEERTRLFNRLWMKFVYNI